MALPIVLQQIAQEMNINELPPEILVNIIRNAFEIDPAKGNQLEKVCWLWKDVIDSHELWKEIAESHLENSEVWKTFLNSHVVENMIEKGKEHPKMERNSQYKEALRYTIEIEKAMRNMRF
ncbi:Oidioi.mRNA.OKI2018_I69.chr1.g1196.t1.cds [Oikopleura dioica]|uniref:Oidioi.mRNA.OKI2018_I69.chr1.g1196.t1.cds n=1 Tax=Oikopleura dioica TaxID=34765 RepID=A0ABN7SM53_OIKDI|nr:Oidioi.mRNA.OKI2018_I69.chr1.g1196.t1.cds [Oikopleura dioica]